MQSREIEKRTLERLKVADHLRLVKRGSDLLSKWVGESEQRIAAAFEEARQREGVLLFDRTGARTSWEVGQVNEMLTWLDQHPSGWILGRSKDGRCRGQR